MPLLLHITRLADGWRGTWHASGRAVRRRRGSAFESSVECRGAAATALRHIGQEFRLRFDLTALSTSVKDEWLAALGSRLGEAWLPALDDHPAQGLVVASEDDEVLGWPWELATRPRFAAPVGCDSEWAVRRALSRVLRRDRSADVGPLRVLFMASAPIDQAVLDHEREEDAILAAARGAHVHVLDSGTLEELVDTARGTRAHVVHLAGHGELGSHGGGLLYFEDAQGRSRPVSAADLAAELASIRSVRLVVLNACETARGAVDGACAALVRAGVPAALGWNASVADDVAGVFAGELYRRLAGGGGVAASVAQGRAALRIAAAGGNDERDASFSLPVLYVSTLGEGPVAQPVRHAARPGSGRRPAPRGQSRGGDSCPVEPTVMGGGSIALPAGFVGRRREQQLLRTTLVDGGCAAATITGLAGIGKTTLAGRAAQRLANEGRALAIIRLDQDARTSASVRRRGSTGWDRLVAALANAATELTRHADATTRRHAAGLLEIASADDLAERIDELVERWRAVPVVMLLDGFDGAISEARSFTRRGSGGARAAARGSAADPLLEAIEAFASRAPAAARLLITARTLPQALTAAPHHLHVPLNDFSLGEMIKRLERDEVVAARLADGTIDDALLKELHAAGGGSPRLLDQVVALLRRGDPRVALRAILPRSASRRSAGGRPPGRRGARTRFEDAALGELTARIQPGAREIVATAAAALLPMPAEVLAQAAGLPLQRARIAAASAEAAGLLQRLRGVEGPELFQVPGVVRRWMSERTGAGALRRRQRRLGRSWHAWLTGRPALPGEMTLTAVLREVHRLAASSADASVRGWAGGRLAEALAGGPSWREADALLRAIPASKRTSDQEHSLAVMEARRGDVAGAQRRLERVWKRVARDRRLAFRLRVMLDRAALAGRFSGPQAARSILQALFVEAQGDSSGLGLAPRSASRSGKRTRAGPSIRILDGDSALLLGEGLCQLGVLALDARDQQEARRAFRNAFLWTRALSSLAAGQRILNLCEHHFGVLACNRQRFGLARRWFERSFARAEAREDAEMATASMKLLAVLDQHRGATGPASQRREAVAAAASELDQPEAHATAASLAAFAALAAERDGQAIELFRQSIEERRRAEDAAGEASDLSNIATPLARTGRVEEAVDALLAALAIHRERRDGASMAFEWGRLSGLATYVGRHAAAARLACVSWALDRAAGGGTQVESEQLFRDALAAAGVGEGQVDAVMRESVQAFNDDAEALARTACGR